MGLSRALSLARTLLSQVSCLELRQAPEIFGPTDINAQTGNQGLSVALNDAGTVTVFRWPRPSFYEQIKHRATDRDEPLFGAAPNAGAFLGLVLDTGDATETVWLREMDAEQRHPEGWTDTVLTEYADEARGITVAVRDVVAPDDDVLVRDVTVWRDPASPVQAARLVAFENFNLVVSKAAGSPVQGWCREAENTDSATYWPDLDAVVHTKAGVDESTRERRHVATAMAFGGPSAGHQVGADAHEPDATPAEHRPRDAHLDAAGGTLAGNDSYTGQTTGALTRELAFSDGEASATVLLAAAETAEEVTDLVTRARDRNPEDVRAAKRAWLSNLLADAPLPDVDDEAIRALCVRALVTLVTNYDPETGAIVASIASQSPYALDWPRDGAYFNHALELLGHHDWVDQHNRWYAAIQSRGGDVPAGNWAMNYYADGVVGGPVPWEIDETGYALWTLWDHYLATGDEAYLRDVYPAISRAAEFLVAYRDPETGLHRKAYEDDNALRSQTAVGAGPIHLGLDAASAAARELGETADAERWAARRDEVGAGIETLWGSAEAAYVDGRPALRHYADVPYVGRLLAWFPVVISDAAEPALYWPVGFRSADDERMERHLDSVWDHVRTSFREPVAGDRRAGLYETQGLLALARAWRGDEELTARVRNGVRWVANHHATDDTFVMGEVWLRDGDEVVTTVSQPHTWAQLLFYYAALEAFPPADVAEGAIEAAGGVLEVLRARSARDGAPLADDSAVDAVPAEEE
jgi:hypothetical protein